MWGNIMSGCFSPLCPTSHRTLLKISSLVVRRWLKGCVGMKTEHMICSAHAYSACILAIAPARREKSFCFFSCNVTRGLFVQLHSLISLFSLVTFAVKIFKLTAEVPHPQTSKRTQGTRWKIYNKLWGIERASEVHNIKSRCVSSATAAG